MKIINFIAFAFVLTIFTSCHTTVDVLSAWKSKEASELKGRNILVIARTADIGVRADFETSIANKLRAKGYKATESFTRFPKMNPDKEMTEEREKLIRDILGYEGYDAVCISVLKDYEETETTHYYNDYYGGMGMMGPYSSYYPSYYGGFYSYYGHPYSYSSFGNYYGSGSSYTSTTKKYVLETLIYNLNKKEGDQLLMVTTTKITDPKDAIIAADKYTEKIAESLSEL